MAVVPVFVSSTFRDFHAERDVMRQQVRPLLDAVVAQYGCRVELVDLRWGVHTGDEDGDEDRRQQAVLDICFREIERARPLFVALLGDRFGWVPSWSRAELALRAAGIDPDLVPRDVPGRNWSVTALEVWHGALNGAVDAVVIDRRLAGEVPEHWLDADPGPTQWLRGLAAEAAGESRDEDAGHRVQHRVITARVRKGSVEKESLAEFERVMVETLAPLVRRQAERVRGALRLSTFAAAQRVAREDRDLAIGRDELIVEIVEMLSDVDQTPPVVLTGASGVGKTTVWRATLKALRDLCGRRIASVIVGVGPGSSTVVDVISRLADELELTVPAEVAGDADAVIEWWAGALAQLKSPWVIGIDGLDRLTAGPDHDRLAVLLRSPDSSVGLLLSTSDPDQVTVLEGRGATSLTVGPLDRHDVERAAAEWGEKAGRQIPKPVLDALAGQPRSGLWVRVAVDELTGVDATDFARAEELERAGESAEGALNRMLLEQAENLPDTDEELLGRLLDRAEGTLLPPNAAPVLGALGLTRSGLPPPYLAALGTVDPLTLSRLRWQLGAQLRSPDPSGRLAPDHDLLRRTLVRRYVEANPARLHDRIATLLLTPPGRSPEVGPGRPAAGRGNRSAAGMSTADPIDVLDGLWHSLHGAGGDLVHRALEATSRLLGDDESQLGPAREILLDAVLDGRAGSGRPPLDNLLDALQAPTAGLGALTLVNAALDWDNFSRLRMDEHLQLAVAAVRLAERLARRTPQDRNVRHELAQAQWCLGHAKLRQCDLPDAERLAKLSLDLRRDLLHRNGPAAPTRYRLELSSACYLVGEVAMRRSDLPAAHRAYEEARQLRAGIQAEAPDNAAHTQALAQVLDRLGSVHRRQNEARRARNLLEQALKMRQRVARRSPWNAELSGSPALTLAELVELARQEGNHNAAEARLTEWLKLARRHVADSPGDATARRSLADAHGAAGDLAMDRRDLPTAEVEYERSLDLVQELAADSEGDIEAQRTWARRLLSVGQVKLRGGGFEAAIGMFRQTADIIRPIKASSPGDADAELELAEVLEYYGVAARCQGELAEAAEALIESLELREHIAGTAPLDRTAQRALAIVSLQVGELDEKRNDRPAALGHYQRAVSILRDLTEAHQESVDLRLDLDWALRNQGRIEEGRISLADRYSTATDLAEARWQAWVASEDPDAQHRLATALARAGAESLAEGGVEVAADHYAAAYDLASRLVDKWPDETAAGTALVIVLAGRAELALQTRVERRARADYDEAQGRARKLLASAPRDPKLANALDALAHLAARRGETETAKRLTNQARGVRARAEAAEPDEPALRLEQIARLRRMAEAAEGNGDRITAEQAWSDAVLRQRRHVQTASGDADARRELSAMLDHLADTAEGNGHAEPARLAYAESLQIAQELASEQPDSLPLQHDVVVSLVNLAIATHAIDDLATARQLWGAALDAGRALAERAPDETGVQYTLAKILRGAARFAAAGEEAGRAVQLNDEAVDLLRGLLPGPLPEPAIGLELVYGLISRGNLAMGRVEPERTSDALAAALAMTLAAAQEALELTRVLLELQADQQSAHRAMIDVLALVQDAGIRGGQAQLAQRAKAEMLRIQREAAADTSSLAAQQDLAVSLSLQGDNAMLENDLDRAEQAYREALGIYERLAAQVPADLDYQQWVFLALWYLADPFERRWEENPDSRASDLAQAVTLLERAVPIARRVTDFRSLDSRVRRDLCEVLRRLSRLKEAQHELVSSRSYVAAAIEQARLLTAQAPENLEHQKLLFLSLDAAGDLAGDVNAAETDPLRVEAAQIARHLALASPGDITTQNRLCLALLDLARIKEKQNDLMAAQEALTEARPVLSRLVEAGGTDHARGLWFLLDSLADLSIRTGDRATARSASEQVLAISAASSGVSPDDGHLRNYRTWALERSGQLDEEDGLWPAAFQHYLEAVVLREGMVADQPGDGELRIFLTNTMTWAAGAAWDANGLATARTLFTEARRLTAELAAGRPDPADLTEKLEKLDSALAALSGGTEVQDDPGFTTSVIETLPAGLGRVLAERLGNRTPAQARPQLGMAPSKAIGSDDSPVEHRPNAHEDADMKSDSWTTGMHEKLAHAVHDRYVEHGRVAGQDARTNSSMVDWSDLSPHLKASNRAQARAILGKLAALDLRAEPLNGSAASSTAQITDDEFEAMARMEHQRWMDERRAQGWVHGPTKNEQTRQHPDIIDWVALSAESKEKDRNAVRAIPDLLGMVGYHVVRKTS